MITKIVGYSFLVIFVFGVDLCGMNENKNEDKEPLLLKEKEHSSKNDYQKTIELLKLNNIFFNQSTIPPKKTMSAFFDAITERDVKSVSFLLEIFPDLIKCTHKNYSSLYYAIKFEDMDMIVLLLYYGAIISDNVLVWAQKNVSLSVLRILSIIKWYLENGQDLDWTIVKNKEVYQDLRQNHPSIDLYKLAKVNNKMELAKKLKPLHKKKGCFVQ